MRLLIYIYSFGWALSVPWPVWVAFGVGVWALAGVAIARPIVEMIRRRDQQVPRESVVARPEQPDTITSRKDAL